MGACPSRSRTRCRTTPPWASTLPTPPPRGARRAGAYTATWPRGSPAMASCGRTGLQAPSGPTWRTATRARGRSSTRSPRRTWPPHPPPPTSSPCPPRACGVWGPPSTTSRAWAGAAKRAECPSACGTTPSPARGRPAPGASSATRPFRGSPWARCPGTTTRSTRCARCSGPATAPSSTTICPRGGASCRPSPRSPPRPSARWSASSPTPPRPGRSRSAPPTPRSPPTMAAAGASSTSAWTSRRRPC
mmetsp:Transcript_50553/g.161717  ORF Transcript_50553/g.161717 Transcript_50553/m.161717 type:complete len:247 (-) Transcript_50553:2169-2909(-)